MLRIRPFFFGIAPESFQATPGTTKPDEVIDGFPEFAFTSSDPEVERKLRALARRIVASHQGGDRIIGFEAHGHADKTLRPPPGQSAAQTEMEVSVDRAENAKELLLQFIEQEGGKPIIAGIRANASAKGFGSAHRIFAPATTPAQMKQNRRVEIFLKVLEQPKPKPQPPPLPEPSPSSFTIQIQSGSITTISIPFTDAIAPSSLSYIMFVEVVDRKRRQKARFRIAATGFSLPGVTVAPTGAVTMAKMTAGSPTQPFSSGSNVTLKDFSGAIEFTQDPGASASVLTRGGDINFMTFAHVRTTPQVVSASNGSSFDNLPSAGLGGTAKGDMSMMGEPKPL
jgi:hypothetical protein